MNTEALHVIHANDNVAVALTDLPVGLTVTLEGRPLALVDAVPFGHKVALTDIAQGTPVVKYGESIGLATCPIRRGQHVHVHNIASTRGRGDLATPPHSSLTRSDKKEPA